MSRARQVSQLIGASNNHLVATPAAFSNTVTVANSGITFGDATVQTTAAYGFGFKNRIINGDMRIDQRNAGANVALTTAGTFTVDRWGTSSNQNGKLIAQRNLDSLTPPVGFTNYLGISVVNAYTPINNEYFSLFQSIEGYNVSDLGFGTANASPVTISFWVRANNTGSYGASLQNGAENRCYSFFYTINAANTWEYKTITIPGDVTGTWTTDNTAGMYLWFGLGATGSRVGTAGSWGTQSGAGLQPSGSFNFVATTGAKLYITGVQLEKGSTATAFDLRPYGYEFALCQRYYEQYIPHTSGWADIAIPYNNGTSNQWLTWRFQTTKRATPVLVNASASTLSGFTSILATNLSPYAVNWNANAGLYLCATSGPYLGASAEM